MQSIHSFIHPSIHPCIHASLHMSSSNTVNFTSFCWICVYKALCRVGWTCQMICFATCNGLFSSFRYSFPPLALAFAFRNLLRMTRRWAFMSNMSRLKSLDEEDKWKNVSIKWHQSRKEMAQSSWLAYKNFEFLTPFFGRKLASWRRKWYHLMVCVEIWSGLTGVSKNKKETPWRKAVSLWHSCVYFIWRSVMSTLTCWEGHSCKSIDNYIHRMEILLSSARTEGSCDGMKHALHRFDCGH